MPKKTKPVIVQGMEEWVRIPGYPNHEASSHGRIRSYLNRGGHGVEGKPRILKLSPIQGRIPYLRLGMRRNGRAKTVYVHRLIALSFIGPRPGGADIDHVDDDPQNNFASNLRYVSRSVNVQKAKCSKLTSERVRSAREKWASKQTSIDSLAIENGVSRACMSMAVSGKTWPNAGGPIDKRDKRFQHG